MYLFKLAFEWTCAQVSCDFLLPRYDHFYNYITGRLVEVNSSPLYRADIPATNGVIHIIDWALQTSDYNGFDGLNVI